MTFYITTRQNLRAHMWPLCLRFLQLNQNICIATHFSLKSISVWASYYHAIVTQMTVVCVAIWELHVGVIIPIDNGSDKA